MCRAGRGPPPVHRFGPPRGPPPFVLDPGPPFGAITDFGGCMRCSCYCFWTVSEEEDFSVGIRPKFECQDFVLARTDSATELVIQDSKHTRGFIFR